jgi:hypothetical protein
MADQKKWFKVWATILIDPHHANLSIQNVGRWTRLGAMIVSSGDAGKLRVIPPAKHFLVAMECADLEEAKSVISMLPNVCIEEGENDNGTFSVIMQNWFKYQVDSTAYDRLKRSRYKRRGEEKRSRGDVEEKLPSPLPPSGAQSKILEWFEKTWAAYPKERRIGKQAALRSYKKRVKELSDALWIGRALDNYLKSKTVQDGFIKNASTFFANVEDYADEGRNSERTHSAMAQGRSANGSQETGIIPEVRQALSGLANHVASGNPQNGIYPGPIRDFRNGAVLE